MASFAALALAFPAYTVSITQFGATQAPGVLNTGAFAAAIANVSAAGGGTVVVPAGTWLTGPFNLSSNLQLLLDASATVLASANRDDWAIVAPVPSYGRGRDFPGPRYQPLIGAYNVSNVRIASTGVAVPGGGGGTINGQGAGWWEGIVNGTLKITPGHLLETAWASDVEVTNVTFVDSPFWNVHFFASTRVWAHGVAIRAPTHSTNTDGFDPDSSSDVLLEDLDVSNGDDVVAIKSGWNQAGVAFGVPCTNVTVRRVRGDTQSACLAIGSEMSGGVANVVVSDITCDAAGQAINIKSALGRGGYIRNVSVSGVVLTGVGYVGTALAATDNYADQYPPAPIDPHLIPIIDGITITNVTAAGPPGSVGRAGDFQGLGTTPAAGQITGVALTDIALGPVKGGWTCANVTGTSSNVSPQPCAALGG
jgi:polygalacturonase